MWHDNTKIARTLGVWAAMVMGVVAIPLLACEDLMRAASNGGEGSPGVESAADFTPRIERGSRLIGMAVTSDSGDTLGVVTDLVLTPGHDRLAYLIVSCGQVGEVGERLVAVPYKAATTRPEHSTTRPEGRSIMLNISDEMLCNAATTVGFAPTSMPDLADVNWVRGNLEFWGVKDVKASDLTCKACPPGQSGSMSWVSKLSGIDVRDLADKSLGELDDIVFDLREGRPVLAIITHGGDLDEGAKLAPIAWPAVEFQPKLGTACVDTDRATLESLAFSNADWPNLNDANFVANVYRKFGEDPYWEVFGYVGGGAHKENGAGSNK